MPSKKKTETSAQKSTWLLGKLQEALETSRNDTELVENLITSGALQHAVHMGTYTTEEAAQSLGIAIRSVRSLTTQSATFPKPTITERRYARSDIKTYANTRQKRTNRTTNLQEDDQ